MPQILGFMHVNVNCSDLERSRRFYEGGLGLIASAHTRPAAAQPGAGFGLTGDALWDAWVLDDPRGMGAAASLDLLRWEQPLPIGSPPGLAPTLGIHRLLYAVASLADVLERVTRWGGRSLPAATVSRAAQSIELAWVLDPDGTALELVADPGCGDAIEARGVALVCRDLERSIAWYERVLGLTVIARESSERAPGVAFGLTADACWSAAVLALPERREQYALRLEQWHAPDAVKRARAVANQLGPFRVALLVDDVHAWHAELERRGAACTAAPVWLDMGPDIPIDGLWALFFFDPDGACVELIQAPEVLA